MGNAEDKKNNIKIEAVKKWTIDIFFYCVGGLLFGFAVNLFFTPNGMIPGGFTGLAAMINHLIGFPIGITSLLLNVPLFIWAFFESGPKYLVKVGVSTVICSIMIDVAEQIPVPVVTQDKLLATIAGGVLAGIGIGLIFMRGGRTGGTDIIAALLKKHIKFLSLGRLVLFSNLVILASTFFVYNSLESPLYSTVAIFIYTKMTDIILNGVDRAKGKMMMIMSGKNDDIAEHILFNLHRGVTKLKSVGAYSGQEGNVLICVVRKPQVSKVLDIIHSVDENAFVIVGDAEEVDGRGFERIDLD